MELEVEIIDGLVMTPNMHDANIFKLEFRENNDLVIGARLVDGSVFSLILKNVYRLLVNNFREGNLVLDVSVTESNEIEIDDAMAFYQSTQPLAKSVIEPMLSYVRMEKKRIVNVSSSYGCELVCICDQICYEK